MNAPSKFKKIRNVTLPLFKWANDVERYYQFIEAMHIGKAVKAAGGKDMEPATIANVIDLESGEMGQVIIGAVLKSIFEEDYPGEEYVGKSFAITQRKVPEKKYNLYTVAEIEADEAAVHVEKKTSDKATGKRK